MLVLEGEARFYTSKINIVDIILLVKIVDGWCNYIYVCEIKAYSGLQGSSGGELDEAKIYE